MRVPVPGNSSFRGSPKPRPRGLPFEGGGVSSIARQTDGETALRLRPEAVPSE
jgi:hypothetical protein